MPFRSKSNNSLADGVTVAKSISLKDNCENLGVQSVQ